MNVGAKAAARRLEEPRAQAMAAAGALGLALWLLVAGASGEAEGWLFEACRAFLAGEAAPERAALGLSLGLWAMWWAMMAAMAAPALAATLAAYADIAELEARGGPVGGRLGAFLLGWGALWAAAAAALAAGQVGLRAAGLLEFGGARAAPAAAGALMIAGGLWQLSAARSGCLAKCRSPIAFLMAEWRPGRAGGLRLGFRHGLHCLGCCAGAALMMLAFGAMSLWLAALIALWHIGERMLPFGEAAARWAGAALLGAGAAALAAAIL